VFDVIFKPTNKLIEKVKRKVYGKTFYCPVCHLELSYHDVDKDGLLVCPLCGIVIELVDVFGHALPVVHDVEIKRYQPKMRIHPLSTHIPIGLFPFALIIGLFILFVTLFQNFFGSYGFYIDESILQYLSSLKKMSDFFMLGSLVFSLLAFASGYYDWYYRYEKRKYRAITLKIYFSWAFILFGIVAFLLQRSGLVFDSQGFIVLNSMGIFLSILYYALMIISMILLVVLGHVGGLFVFGK
jgi:uncharacterized membrane protein